MKCFISESSYIYADFLCGLYLEMLLLLNLSIDCSIEFDFSLTILSGLVVLYLFRLCV